MFRTLKHKIISFTLNIGKNPQDNEEVRMLKRIWSITLLFASPVSITMCLVYFLLNKPSAAKFWLLQAFFWSGSLVLFSLVRRGIQWFALSSQIFLILSSFVMVIALGGLFSSDGAIFLGLIGVLYAMVFPKLHRALLLFLLYIGLVVVLIFLEPKLRSNERFTSDIHMVLFWITFIIVAIFTILAIYYFVNQRHKAYKLNWLIREKNLGNKELI